MHANKFWIDVARLALTVALPVVLLLSPLYLFVTPSFVHHEYAQNGFPPSVRFVDAERVRLSDTILHYLRGRAGLEEMAAMQTNAGETALRADEVQHLVDVRIVMDAFFVVHGLALAVALAALVGLLLAGGSNRLPGVLHQGVWLAGGLIVFVVLASFIDFDVFFTRFHQLFFSAGTWVFYETDTLIQLYPLRLWIDAVWKIGVVVALELALTLGIARLLERRALSRASAA
ncbi:MAG: lipoprotein intramolecular transacylase Lit [Anaerolineae bacterium]